MTTSASLNPLQALYVGMANQCGHETITEKRVAAALILAALSTQYFIIACIAFPEPGYAVITWIGDVWPWRSENVRSFKNVGFAFVLFIMLPICIMWWRIGRSCESAIALNAQSAACFIFILAWPLASVTCYYISLNLQQHFVAFLVQNALFIGATSWFYIRRASPCAA